MLKAARGGTSTHNLATALGWKAQSKVVRIENGDQIPTPAEVDQWADAVGADTEARERWHAELQEAVALKSTFRRRQPVSQAPPGSPSNHLESVATFIRVMRPSAVPDLLQTAEYAREMIAHNAVAWGSDIDVDAAVAALMRRREVLYDTSKRFQFLIGEGALRYIPSRVDLMHAQLDQLISSSALQTVELGIVPMLKPLATMLGPAEFVLYDKTDAVVTTGPEDRQHTGGAVADLHTVMDLLWKETVRGDSARALILTAKAELPDGNGGKPAC